MESKAPDVTAYIHTAPAARKDILTAIRGLCVDLLDGFQEGMDYGMPSYKRDGEVEIAFASQKNYIFLYVLRQEVLDSHPPALRGTSLGKGCGRYSSPTKVDLDVIRSMLEATASSRGPIC
jgi:hypothetical protein